MGWKPGSVKKEEIENKIREVANIESAIRDSGEITGGFTQQQITHTAYVAY